MANIIAYQQLQQYTVIDYAAQFANVQHIQQPHIPLIGEAIPLKSDGSLQYVSSLTPLQKQKIIAITGLVLSILGLMGTILAAELLNIPLIYLACLGTGGGFIASLIGTIHCFNQIDLNSPKTRRKETELIRTHKLSLSQINRRYSNFETVAAYALMGNAQPASYWQAAHLSLRQAEADRIYASLAHQIHYTYKRAIAPAQQTYNRARNYESMAVANTVTAPRHYRVIPALIAIDAAYERRDASAQLAQTIDAVAPLYQHALQRLNHAYRAVTKPLSDAFLQLPLF